MSVLKRRSNNIKDGQYVIAFSDSRALIDISNILNSFKNAHLNIL